jgi:hypothetical protein
MDLTPLIQNPSLDLADFTAAFIEEFREEVKAKLNKRLGKI